MLVFLQRNGASSVVSVCDVVTAVVTVVMVVLVCKYCAIIQYLCKLLCVETRLTFSTSSCGVFTRISTAFSTGYQALGRAPNSQSNMFVSKPDATIR